MKTCTPWRCTPSGVLRGTLFPRSPSETRPLKFTSGKFLWPGRGLTVFVLGFALSFLAAVGIFGRSRADTSFEVLALRQQVAVRERKRTTSLTALRTRADTHIGKNVFSGSGGQHVENLGGSIQDDTFVWLDEVYE